MAIIPSTYTQRGVPVSSCASLLSRFERASVMNLPPLSCDRHNFPDCESLLDGSSTLKPAISISSGVYCFEAMSKENFSFLLISMKQVE
jgi:hypothetical protein